MKIASRITCDEIVDRPVCLTELVTHKFREITPGFAKMLSIDA
jgi:hypothetical protein